MIFVSVDLNRNFTAYNFIESLLQENEGKRMSLTDSLKHPWLRSYTPTYNLRAYDTVSSLDPHDFSMLSSMPGFDMNASVTTNLNGLQITTNGHMPGAVVVAEGDHFIQSSFCFQLNLTD